MTQQRHYTRLPFRTTSTLAVNAGGGPPGPARATGPKAPTQLIDISLKGALVAHPPGLDLSVGTPVTLSVQLADSPVVIAMVATVAHVSSERVGLHCTAIDVDSMTHLRRLMELNLGDPGLLDRELLALG